jgi:hypothetical protein
MKLAVLGMLLLAGCTASVPRPDEAELLLDHPEQFVVITLRSGAATPTMRAGSSPREYGTALQYAVAPPTRAAVHEIAADYHLQAVKQWPIAQLGVHCIVYRLAAKQSLSEMLKRLSADSRIETAQPLNAFATLANGYNDPYAALQSSLPTMGVPQAHAWSRGKGVSIAVVDTAADVTHADLVGRNIAVQDFTGAKGSAAAHGTAVTGIIAATSNNRLGIVGVAPEAQVHSLAACWPDVKDVARASCNSFTLARAIARAIELKVDIVNLSLGGPSDPLLRRLVEYGLAHGMIFVGALPPDRQAIGFPCDIAGVLSVDTVGHRPIGSALFAPGTDVLTLLPQDRYDFLSGSSLAAANVSGSIALLLSQHRSSAEQIHTALAGTAHDGGSINVCAALVGEQDAAKCGQPIASSADAAPSYVDRASVLKAKSPH